MRTPQDSFEDSCVSAQAFQGACTQNAALDAPPLTLRGLGGVIMWCAFGSRHLTCHYIHGFQNAMSAVQPWAQPPKSQGCSGVCRRITYSQMLRVRLGVQQVKWIVGSGEWTRASGEWSVVVVRSVYCVLCNAYVNYVLTDLLGQSLWRHILPVDRLAQDGGCARSAFSGNLKLVPN